MVGKAGLEPANSGSQSKEISTGSGMVRIAGFKPAISWSRITRSRSSCPISGYDGGIDEDRTHSILSARQVLPQLSYNPINGAPGSNRTAIWWLQVNCNNHYTTGQSSRNFTCLKIKIFHIVPLAFLFHIVNSYIQCQKIQKSFRLPSLLLV